MSGESCFLTDFEGLIKSMERNMEESRIDTFKNVLLDANSQRLIDSNLSYFVQWLTRQIFDRQSIPDDPFVPVLTEYLTELPLRFDRNEVLLVLTGLFHSNRGQSFTLWLRPIASCVDEHEKWRFPRIAPVFNDISASLSLLCKKAAESRNYGDISKALNECIVFYRSIIRKTEFLSLSLTDIRTLEGHLLFLFAQPLSLIEYNAAHASLFIDSIQLYRKISSGLFTSYNEIRSCLSGAKKDPDIPICVTIPAWLRILKYVLLDTDRTQLENCWPLVYSQHYHLDLMHDFIVMLLDGQNTNKFIGPSETHCYPTLSEELYIHLKIRAIEVLRRLISTMNVTLTASWWSPRRKTYINLLKTIATQPVSTEKLPDIVNQAVCCIDSLIQTSTYTAQCELFYDLLPPRNNVHHGFRGHLITLCKDVIHKCWISVQQSGLQVQLDMEKSKGEESPQLPLQRHVLCCLCEMIFAYPHVASTDSLVDQSSWILAAANMALYIFLRYHNVATTDSGIPILDEIMTALLRQSDGSYRFFTKFYQPLKKDLDTECNRVQATVNTLSNESQKVGDKKQKEQLTSSLAAQEATLLRLRLLQVTVDGLSVHYDKLNCSIKN